MTTPNHDHSAEVRATPEQAQRVVDEIDRITAVVPVHPGLKGMKNHSAPNKTRWHDGMLFIRHPDGESNIDDPESINLGSVSWDNEDGSRTSYGVELTTDGTQLTKHTYPPTRRETSERHDATTQALGSGDYASVAFNALADLAEATNDRQARVQERSLGMHFANQTEAAELIARLEQTQPAPERAF